MTDVIAAMRVLDAAAIRARVDLPRAVRALQDALRAGFDPDDDPPRSIVDVRHGQLLLMPADLGRYAGQKLATVAPANPGRGLERIQAVYIVLDAETLSPVALLDGTELTNLRTPAMSAAMLDLVAEPDAANLVVFGTGPQGVRHVEAMRAIRPIARVRFVGRDPGRAERAVAAFAASGLDVAVGTDRDVADADLVVCATTAREPLFDAALVRDRTALVAVGSHERDARELPGALLGRAQVIVETERVSRTEAGDVIMAVEEGHLSPGDVVPMARIATGHVAVARDRPRVVKTCGMGWQDLAVAQAAIEKEGA
ncbi:ornithine cyclodeaminase family protein [Agromyces sp. SYSU K20354]|uniref:ornithine cyclodeaminase family protein n=1 Tax=Agromyces cavernae TaxID=2898659 RepID=UPI001E5D927A|nr:ornithine cyclodeaminase family protein [Agromyces cavernae]MCD2442451.1 ornithine cyclodeaminase family protein [Agromyces cavernae]